MKIKNLKELRKHIEKAISNSLENEVFEDVRETERRHVQTDVFDVYKPRVYHRREFYPEEYVSYGETGIGVKDERNIIFDPVKNGVLKVENVAKFNPRYKTKNHGPGLEILIEYGHGARGIYYDCVRPDAPRSSWPPYAYPRPFIANTREEIKQTKSHVKAMKLGLRRNKIECE